MCYQFKIHYKQGKESKVGDPLSRQGVEAQLMAILVVRSNILQQVKDS